MINICSFPIFNRFKGKLSFKYTKQDDINLLKDIIIKGPKDPKLNKGFVSVMKRNFD